MGIRIKNLIIFLFLISLFYFISGCTLANRSRWKANRIAAENNAELQSDKKITSDAFLFDMKIINKGKKNSVRLDIYRNGDSLAVFARGYLGKGVLKTLVNFDSVVAFFPTENQFYSGKLHTFFSGDCFKNIPLERMVVDLFRITPDKIDYSYEGAYLSIVTERSGFRKYRLTARNCDEFIELDYDWHKEQFILEKFKYSSEDGNFKLDAKRRKYKLDVRLPNDKYKLSIPSTASRIYP